MQKMKPPPCYLGLAALSLEPQTPGYLLGQIQIDRASFHVEAIEVDGLDNHPYRAVDGALQSRVDHLCSLDDADNHQRVMINGKPHLILIYPWQR